MAATALIDRLQTLLTGKTPPKTKETPLAAAGFGHVLKQAKQQHQTEKLPIAEHTEKNPTSANTLPANPEDPLEAIPIVADETGITIPVILPVANHQPEILPIEIYQGLPPLPVETEDNYNDPNTERHVIDEKLPVFQDNPVNQITPWLVLNPQISVLPIQIPLPQANNQMLQPTAVKTDNPTTMLASGVVASQVMASQPLPSTDLQMGVTNNLPITHQQAGPAPLLQSTPFMPTQATPDLSINNSQTSQPLTSLTMPVLEPPVLSTTPAKSTIASEVSPVMVATQTVKTTTSVLKTVLPAESADTEHDDALTAMPEADNQLTLTDVPLPLNSPMSDSPVLPKPVNHVAQGQAQSSPLQPVSQQVSQQMADQLQLGRREVTFQLNPENLGQVRVQLASVGPQQVASRLIVESPEAMRQLQQDVTQLKQALYRQGIQLDSVTVVMAPQDAGNANNQNYSAGGNSSENPSHQSLQGQAANHQHTAQQQAFQQAFNRPQQGFASRPVLKSDAWSTATPVDVNLGALPQNELGQHNVWV
jgi:flagellar hook-length control protein FliK